MLKPKFYQFGDRYYKTTPYPTGIMMFRVYWNGIGDIDKCSLLAPIASFNVKQLKP